MATGRPLPWSSWQEWQQVGDWLFAGTREAEASAISRVNSCPTLTVIRRELAADLCRHGSRSAPGVLVAACPWAQIWQQLS